MMNVCTKSSNLHISSKQSQSSDLNDNILLNRKKLFNAVHMFVHLNLAISLLLGYLVFMFGIETATSSTVSMMSCSQNNLQLKHMHP